MSEKQNDLKRKVGVLGLSANMVNTIVGAGIFVLPATVAAGLGSASILAYLACGILVALVMLCFAEIGSKITASGGAYAYIGHTFGPYFGFLTAILYGIAAISADAAVANAIADIVGSFSPTFKIRWVRILFFLAIFGGLAYINVIGVRNGVGLVKLITIAKLTPLVLLVIFAWSDVSASHLAIKSIPALEDIGKISLILFFAFQGGEGGLSISGEVKNPQKTIPRAIFLSITGVLILYILIQTVSQGVLGSSLATYKENPLSEVASRILGPFGFTIITVGAAVSMFGNLSSEVLSIPRILFGAAKDRVIPIPALAEIHQKFGTPYIAIIVYTSLGFIFATVGGFMQMAIISSTAVLLVYLGVSLSVIKLRWVGNRNSKGFTIPGGYLVPTLAVGVVLIMLSSLSRLELVAFGLTIVGLSLLYFLSGRLRYTA